MHEYEIPKRQRSGLVKEGADTHVLRLDAYRIRRRGRRIVQPALSLRIRSCWTSLMWGRNRSGRRQAIKAKEGVDVKSAADFIHTIKEPIEIEIPCKSRVRKWAFENAFTLIFLAALCAIQIVANIIVLVVFK